MHSILNKGNPGASAMFGLWYKLENLASARLNQSFRNESGWDTKFHVKLRSVQHIYSWNEIKFQPSNKLWSFREEEVPLHTTSQEGDGGPRVKGKNQPL